MKNAERTCLANIIVSRSDGMFDGIRFCKVDVIRANHLCNMQPAQGITRRFMRGNQVKVLSARPCTAALPKDEMRPGQVNLANTFKV